MVVGAEINLRQRAVVTQITIHAAVLFAGTDVNLVVRCVINALKVTDLAAVRPTAVGAVQMGKAGINKKCLAGYGGEVYCFMSDDDVAQAAKRNKTTRAAASMDKAAKLGEQVIFAIGNAPTALVRLYELIKEEKIAPELVIAVPVGFVNVVQSKELILSLENTPYIVARGRKGGSNIAACICNALLYMGDGGKRE